MTTEPINPDAEVEALLTEANLPVADLRACRGLVLLGCREHGRLVSAVGIEAYGNVGLLRSLVVHQRRRNSGLGAKLVSDAEAWAARHGIKTLYLLTTTAPRFFAKHGYLKLSRSEAPEAIASTAQFSDLCPTTSLFMRKALVEGLEDHKRQGLHVIED